LGLDTGGVGGLAVRLTNFGCAIGIRESGYTPLSKTLKSEGSRKLACDLLFESPDGFSVLLVEQKMRDDHDSSKREGQFANFKLKIEAVRERYEDSNLHAVMYFVDPNQKKKPKLLY
jgi:hypothetical protein